MEMADVLCDKKELEDIFQNGQIPAHGELTGEYRVKILTGFPDFSRFNHRKVFCNQADKSHGYNVMFNGWRWGYFSLHYNQQSSLGALIDYEKKQNIFLLRPIRDYVKSIERGKFYLGKFRYRIHQQEKFVGYFSLSRIRT